jgi:hypothetical protein
VIIPVGNIYLRENVHLRLSALNALIGRVDFRLKCRGVCITILKTGRILELPMPPPRRLSIKLFDPKEFLANAGIGRTIHECRAKQAIFSQGQSSDAVYYIQEGRVRLSVLSKQGKEATIALLGPWRFPGRGLYRLGSTHPFGNRYCDYELHPPKNS